MLEYLFLGGGFAFAAAIQPGPLQAFLLSSVVQRGWRRTLPASFSPLLSDGPIALFVLIILTHVPAAMTRILQAAGGILLLYFAGMAFSQWKKQAATDSLSNGKAPRTIIQAAMVNILNPNPYFGWSLVLGPAVLNAWNRSPGNAAILIIAFYGTMVIALACTILIFGTTRFLGPVGRNRLVLVSAIMLTVLGVYQLVAALLKTG